MEKALTLFLYVKSAALAITVGGLVLYLILCAVVIIKDYFDWR